MAESVAKFERQERYIVIKKSDLQEAVSAEAQEHLKGILHALATFRGILKKGPLKAVVVEQDWPEYEWVWGLIQARVTGQPNELQRLQRRIDELEAENAALRRGVKTPFFVHDSHSGFDEFATLVEADNEAAARIEGYLDEGWSDEVTSVVRGLVLARAQQTDRKERPEALPLDDEGTDAEGDYWASGWQYRCNYELLPIPGVADG